jgi:hypothetical protein
VIYFGVTNSGTLKKVKSLKYYLLNESGDATDILSTCFVVLLEVDSLVGWFRCEQFDR